MTRTRLSLISTTAFASMLGAAIPAFAQAPVPPPPPMMAPAPVMAPAMPNMPMAPEMVMPVAPVVAPKAADDMSGSVGFGVGVVAGTALVKPDTNLMMKYWVNDAMALIPKLSLGLGKAKGADASWSFSPSVLADFTLIKGASTRFSFGVGLGLSFEKAKKAAPTTTPTDPATPVASNDTKIGIFVPAGLNVEHFFARWFSMGMGANFNLIDFKKQGDGWSVDIAANNIMYSGSLFIYTD